MDYYLALEDGPPRFPQGFSCPAVLGNSQKGSSILFTGLSPSMVVHSRSIQLSNSFVTFWFSPRLPHNPCLFSKSRFGLFPFRSPLLRKSHLISFPRGTEMFHFPPFASPSCKAGRGLLPITAIRFPYSGTLESKPA
jgi:hypothetical protein